MKRIFLTFIILIQALCIFLYLLLFILLLHVTMYSMGTLLWNYSVMYQFITF